MKAKPSLVAKMTQLSDKLTKIPVKFGVPTYKPIQVVVGWDDNGLEIGHNIQPTPQVLSVGKADFGKVLDESSIILGAEDRWVLISRSWPYDLINGETVEFWVLTDYDGRESRYKPVYVDTNNLLYYKVLIQRFLESR